MWWLWVMYRNGMVLRYRILTDKTPITYREAATRNPETLHNSADGTFKIWRLDNGSIVHVRTPDDDVYFMESEYLSVQDALFTKE